MGSYPDTLLWPSPASTRLLSPWRQGAVGLSFAIVVTLLVLLGLAGFYQLKRSSETLHMAARNAGGVVAEELAAAAIEEAGWRVQKLLTDPTHPLWTDVRTELIRARKAALDLSKEVWPEHLSQRLAKATDRPLYRYLKIEYLNAVLLIPQKPDDPQRVEFDCAVTLTVMGHSIYRRVVERRPYGFMLVAPLKPFDRVTVAILQHDGIPAVRGSLAALLQAMRDFNQAAALLGSVLSGGPATVFPPPFIRLGTAPSLSGVLAGKAAWAKNEMRTKDSGFDDRLAAMTESERSWFDWSLVAGQPEAYVGLPEAPSEGGASGASVQEVPQSSLFARVPPNGAAILSAQPSVSLDLFDHEVRLRQEYQPALRTAQTCVESYNRMWPAYLGRDQWPVDAAARARLVNEWARSLRQVRPFIEECVKKLNPITRHLEAHGRSGITSDTLKEYERSVCKSPRPLAFHLSDQEDLKLLTETFPVFCGHIAYCGKKDLKVNLPQFAGLAIISAQQRGPGEEERSLVVEALGVRDPTRDLLVLHGERVEFRTSDIQSGVHVTDRLFLRYPSPRIRGNLVLERLRPLKERDKDEELAGTVTYEPTLSAGAIWRRKGGQNTPPLRPLGSSSSSPLTTLGLPLDHYLVTLSPRGLQRAVLRTPSGSEGRQR